MDNQPRLLAQLKTLAQQTQPEDRFVDATENTGANYTIELSMSLLTLMGLILIG